MTKSVAVTLLVATIAGTAPVYAQTPEPAPAQTPAPAATPAPEPKPATPEEIAAARAQADEIIRKADAADLFDNITTEGFAKIRHKMSGMECGFDPGGKVARINIYPGLPRGDDVSCTSTKVDLLDSIYATRFKPAPNLDQAYAMYLREILTVRSDVKPFEGQVASISVDKAVAPIKSGYFVFTDKDGSVLGEKGAKVVSRLAVSVMDGWVFEQRVSGPFDKSMMVSLMGEISMWAMLEKIQEAKAAAATPPTPAPTPTPAEPEAPVTPAGSPPTP